MIIKKVLKIIISNLDKLEVRKHKVLVSDLEDVYESDVYTFYYDTYKIDTIIELSAVLCYRKKLYTYKYHSKLMEYMKKNNYKFNYFINNWYAIKDKKKELTYVRNNFYYYFF